MSSAPSVFCSSLPLLGRRRLISVLLLLVAPIARSTELPDRTPAERRIVVESIAARLERSYVLADEAAEMAQRLREQATAGAYDRIDNLEAFASRLTTDLQAISRDGHLRVRYHPDPAQVIPAWNTPGPDAEVRHRRYSERSNHGFVRVEILAANIGYLRLDEFGDPALGGETAAAALRFVAHTDALIIDLRANGGGHGGMEALLSTYLFGGKRVHLSDFHIRERNETIQSWTAPFVPGPAYADKPVFVLVSASTASAAESFAYNLQVEKRIVVVGRKTTGAANPGAFVRVSDHLAVFIPDGRPVHPRTGTNWERVGVQPDVDVKTENALSKAHQLALEQLLGAPAAEPEDTEARRQALAALGKSSE